MTGVPSYSTVPAENVQANTGIIWDEGMSPASVNNSARQNMADMRLQWNDASWFAYGTGSKNTVIPVYASGTSVTVAGVDVTSYWHANRRVKAVGSSTGTIYGKVASSSFSTNTTINFTWDSGSLSNEAIALYAGTQQVTGKPVAAESISGTANSLTLVTPALGTPASGTLTSCTGLPISTGVSGLGTGVATLLSGAKVGSGTSPLSGTSVAQALAPLATSSTFSLPSGGGMFFIVENGSFGSGTRGYLYYNAAGAVGILSLGEALAGGSSNINAVTTVAGGITIANGNTSGACNYTVTVISGS